MAFTFSSTSGSSGETTITVSATPNLQTSSIVEYYTLSNTSGHSVSMPVTQKANQPVEKYIQISPSEFNIGPNQQNSTIQVSSNDRWIIRSNGWIGLSGKYDKGNTDIEVEEKPNELSGNGNTIVGIYFKENTGLTRTGFISGHCLSSTAVTASTTVVQSGSSTKPYISVYPHYLDNVPSSGIQSSITVSSNTSWSASTLDKWVTIGTTAGTGNGTVAFTADTNTDGYSRSGGIKVVNEKDGVYDYFTFKQAPNEKQYIFIEPDAFKVPSTGSTGNEIRVKANCEYDITADARWISLDATSGSGNTVVTFSTDENLSKYGETGNIIFSNSAVSTYAVVERESVETYISANTSSIIVNVMEETSTIVYVSSNVDWFVSVDNGGSNTRWLTASPLSGSGSGTIGITIKSGSTPMSGSVMIYNTQLGLRYVIDIVQKYGNNVLVYTTTDQQIIDFTNRRIGGEGSGYRDDPISNTYENGVGLAVYDRPITHIGVVASASSYNYNGFHNATTLASVEIPDTVTLIGFGAFLSCTSLTALTIPSGVTEICTYAFSGSGIQKMYWNASQCTNYFGERPFNYALSLTDVICGDNVSTLPERFLYGAGALQRVRISPNTTVLPWQAFLQTGLKDFTVPDQIEEIQEDVFSASQLTALTINSGSSLVTGNRIGASGVTLFLKSSNLTANTVKGLGRGGFVKFLYLDVETIPQNYIRYDNFAWTNLVEVHLSENVRTISEDCFYDVRMTNIYSHSRTAPILDGYRIFYNSQGTSRTVHYPAGSDYSSWEEYYHLSGSNTTFIADL